MKVRAIAIAAMIAMSAAVVAQSVPPTRTLTWNPSLSYVSGGSFDESAIEKYALYCDSEFILEFPNDYTRRYVVDVVLLGAGDHVCGVTEFVGGIESLLSNTVAFPLGQRTPGSPTLTVE
jgi:hypothetical protein